MNLALEIIFTVVLGSFALLVTSGCVFISCLAIKLTIEICGGGEKEGDEE